MVGHADDLGNAVDAWAIHQGDADVDSGSFCFGGARGNTLT